MIQNLQPQKLQQETFITATIAKIRQQLWTCPLKVKMVKDGDRNGTFLKGTNKAVTCMMNCFFYPVKESLAKYDCRSSVAAID